MKAPQSKQLGLLTEENHSRIIADLDRIAMRANVPVGCIKEPMDMYCENREVQWVKSLRQHIDGDAAGLCYVGFFEGGVGMRMAAIAGACIRNYIDARLVPVNDLMKRESDVDPLAPTVLLIPDFFTGPAPQWRASVLMAALVNRHAHGKLTVLYVSDLASLKAVYGDAMHEHVSAFFHKIRTE